MCTTQMRKERSMTKTNDQRNAAPAASAAIVIEELDLGFDLEITKVSRRTMAKGTWVCGTLHDHRFEALVFPEHAENPDYEIGDSRISKLWLQRISDRKVVFNWDRGADIAAA